MTTVLILKLVGAALALAAGIWLGLGMPGFKKPEDFASGREATLDKTWMNRMMRNRLATPRRFDTRRLIRPDREPEKQRPDSAIRESGSGDGSGDAQRPQPS